MTDVAEDISDDIGRAPTTMWSVCTSITVSARTAVSRCVRMESRVLRRARMNVVKEVRIP